MKKRKQEMLKCIDEWIKDGGLTQTKSTLKLYSILAVLLILITEGSYLMSGTEFALVNGNETSVSGILNNSKLYQFSDKGNGVITVYLKNYTSNISLEDNFDAIDRGVSELKSKCNVTSRIPLVWNGTTAGYSVDVSGTCDLNLQTKNN